MGIELRLPNITATTPEGQIAQVRSYLTQLTEQLNFAFNSISNGETMESYKASQADSVSKEEQAKNTFSELKSLIIKSADIVEAYYKAFDLKMASEGKYMAVSEFGTYYEESSGELLGRVNGIEQKYTDVQTVVDDLKKVVGSVSTDASIVSGMLKYVPIGEYEGVPMYGIQIGQSVTDEVTGEEIFNKMAMLTSQGLELYASTSSSEPSAIFKYNTMYITNAEISGTLTLGGYQLDTTNGIAFKWKGR